MEIESAFAPLWTIQRSSFSSGRSSLGGSALISPDISILVNGGHLDLSCFTECKSFWSVCLSGIVAIAVVDVNCRGGQELCRVVTIKKDRIEFGLLGVLLHFLEGKERLSDPLTEGKNWLVSI